MDETTTLILEGGAMRGLFTSGVLDVFMEQELYLPQVVGVSAGVLNGVNYVARQPGRSRNVNLNYANDPRYMGTSHLLKNFSYFNFDFLLGEVSETLDPLDTDTLYSSPQKLWAQATDCRTGKPVFYEKSQLGPAHFLEAVRASASLPLMGRMVRVGRDVCLDGGVSQGVPLPADLPFACGKTVLVLTREKGFRKGGQPYLVRRLYRRRYSGHPELLEALLAGPEVYNRRMDEIDALEAAGQLFAIRPDGPVTVARTERSVEKLDALYRRGRAAAEAALPALKEYLELA
ncbi:MAG TPA: patatin family protein [Candidatus Fournierella merdigallinarum]|nr:patatin family protein [Candidatus Fournierella merdigallinarum]